MSPYSHPEHQSAPMSPPNSFMKRTATFIGIIVLLIITRNFLTRDYTGETKSFLTSIGRADAIESVVPKTVVDLRLERKKQLSTFDQLVVNMTVVMADYKGLRADMDRLKQKVGPLPIDQNVTEIAEPPSQRG